MMVLRLISTIMPLLVPFYLKELVDLITQAEWGDKLAVLPEARWIFMIIICIEGIHIAWRRIFDYIILKFELSWMVALYHKAFDWLHRHSYRFFTNSFGGTLVKRVNKLVRWFEVLTDTFFFSLYSLFWTLVIMITIVMIENVLVWLVYLWFSLVFLVVQWFLFKRKLPAELASHEAWSKLTGVIADTITNHDTIAVFAWMPKEMKRFVGEVDEWKKIIWVNRYKHINIHAINSILVIIFEVAILSLSIHLRSRDALSVWAFLLFQFYLLRLVYQIYDISNVFKRLYNAMGESAEMIEILDEPIEIPDGENASPLELSQWSIQFDAVNFAYNPERVIFQKLDMHIQAWEKVALVWQSGAWKSTIIKLLFRYFDIQHGAISIDGQNIAEVTQESLRWQISMVPQDPILFHRTLAENIAYGKPDATMDEIIAASKMARCHHFIEQLEEGYDTFVGERWVKLSWWERQRVAIARAILENNKILVMDEATSSLDSESEKLIQEAIQEVMIDKTAIVVAHRLSTIKKMDRILVFDQWQIVEEWSHEDLLNITDGVYRKLWMIQAW